jgi:hypothetical protein
MNRRALLQALAALPLVGSWLGGAKAAVAVGALDTAYVPSNLVIKCIEWWWARFDPTGGVQICSDGRVRLIEAESGQTLVFPAPAAEIWKQIEARKSVSNIVDKGYWPYLNVDRLTEI